MPSSVWAPITSGAHVFQPFRRDDSVVKAFAQSQAACHEQRLAYNCLLNESVKEQKAWMLQKVKLEEELRHLHAHSSEVERAFRERIFALSTALEKSENEMQKLDLEFMGLKSSSGERINELENKLLHLNDQCNYLTAEKTSLQQSLETAQTEELLRRAAETRVRELEEGIARVQRHAKRLLDRITIEKEAAEADAAAVREHLTVTTSELHEQRHHRGKFESQAAALAAERAKLAAALEVERLINEPLRHTDYAATTLSHVMRSEVGYRVRQCGRPGGKSALHAVSCPGSSSSSMSRSSSRPHAATAAAAVATHRSSSSRSPSPSFSFDPFAEPPPMRSSPLPPPKLPSSRLLPVPSPPGSPGAWGSMFAARPRSAGTASPDATAAAELAAAAAAARASARKAQGSVGSGRKTMMAINRASMAEAGLGTNDFTRLGRAWATTTASAGLPHPCFLDNVRPARHPYPPHDSHSENSAWPATSTGTAYPQASQQRRLRDAEQQRVQVSPSSTRIRETAEAAAADNNRVVVDDDGLLPGYSFAAMGRLEVEEDEKSLDQSKARGTTRSTGWQGFSPLAQMVDEEEEEEKARERGYVRGGHTSYYADADDASSNDYDDDDDHHHHDAYGGGARGAPLSIERGRAAEVKQGRGARKEGQSKMKKITNGQDGRASSGHENGDDNNDSSSNGPNRNGYTSVKKKGKDGGVPLRSGAAVLVERSVHASPSPAPSPSVSASSTSSSFPPAHPGKPSKEEEAWERSRSDVVRRQDRARVIVITRAQPAKDSRKKPWLRPPMPGVGKEQGRRGREREGGTARKALNPLGASDGDDNDDGERDLDTVHLDSFTRSLGRLALDSSLDRHVLPRDLKELDPNAVSSLPPSGSIATGVVRQRQRSGGR